MKLIKNIKKNTIILLMITILILFIVLKDDFSNIVKSLSSMNIGYILLAIILFLLSIFFKAYVNYKTIANKEKISLLEAFKHNLITQFFNGITPFSTGGQPMEIYMLTEHKIKLSEATNITIQNFIFYQTALVIYGMLAVMYNKVFYIFPQESILKKFVLLGFLINTLVAVALFMITFSKTMTEKIAHLIINFLSSIKIIKNQNQAQEKIDKKLNEFHESAKKIRKRKKLFIGGVGLNLLSLTCLYIIPLLIVYSLKDFTSLTISKTLTASAYVLIIGSFVPIPGASGGIEYGFLKFFGTFLSKNITTAVLLVWRFITYYLGMILGALLFSLEKKAPKE